MRGVWSHILKLHDDEIRRQEVSFRLQKNGRVCREYMRFNRDTLEWEMNYDPYDCGRNRCAGMCPILGHELCYPQLVGTIQLSGGRRHVKKYIWSF